jgi:hypothetical protein
MKSLIQHELRMNDRHRNALRAAENAGFRLIAAELRMSADFYAIRAHYGEIWRGARRACGGQKKTASRRSGSGRMNHRWSTELTP